MYDLEDTLGEAMTRSGVEAAPQRHSATEPLIHS
jgi:hypothetical protein